MRKAVFVIIAAVMLSVASPAIAATQSGGGVSCGGLYRATVGSRTQGFTSHRHDTATESQVYSWSFGATWNVRYTSAYTSITGWTVQGNPIDWATAQCLT